MDANLITGLVAGALAGCAGGVINLALWRHTVQHTRLFGVQLHSGLAHTFRETLEEIPGQLDKTNFKQIEEKILHIFDEFMSKKLIEKMPVLSLFIDEKLIAEIRAIFRHEMEDHLPGLLKKNLVTEKNIDTVITMLRNAITKGIKKYKKHLYIYLLMGTAGGALIGLIVGLIM